MATCPKCSVSIAARAVVCPHCGYDFPDPPQRPEEMTFLQIAFLVLSSLGAIAGGALAVWRFVLG